MRNHNNKSQRSNPAFAAIASIALAAAIFTTGCGGDTVPVQTGTESSSVNATAAVSNVSETAADANEITTEESAATSSAATASGSLPADTKKEDTAAAAETAASADNPAETAAKAETAKTQTAASSKKAKTYLSELTGEAISKSLIKQRPIAVMIDNDQTALPHYGLSEADVVYEMMNSTANNRITRLMALYKNWTSIKRIGSVRSTRPTNVMLASEWNALLCHDGGPYYNNQYFKYGWAEHISGIFGRINNGKAHEFTEYVLTGDVAKGARAKGYSTNYDKYRNADKTHFNFGKVSFGKDAAPATKISFPFPHNQSKLIYNSGKYDYYEYGSLHKDAEDGKKTSFTNVILQDTEFSQLDKNGYLIYNCIGLGVGYYVNGGKCIPVTWAKAKETDITRYYDLSGKEITIAPGKTYIALVPSDVWSNLKFN